MLVITRREGEEVVIGDPANPIGVVRIASIKGDRVRVAFDFPRHIDVHRREVAEQILAGVAPVGAGAGHAAANGHVHANGHAHVNGHVNGVAAESAAPAVK
jgi:carbon storage regulator CsrA